MFMTENLEWCMDYHPEDAQVSRHKKDAATVASKQLQTHVSSERTGKNFLLIICFLHTVNSPFVPYIKKILHLFPGNRVHF
jgi:hypothetical protein